MRRAAATLLLVVFAACQASPVSTAMPGPITTPPTDPPMTVGAEPSPSQPGDTAAVELDATLLEVLPADVNGFPVTEAEDEAAIAINDPALPRIASGINAGVAVDTATANLVSAWVVRLRDGAFDDGAYRQWRDSYDDGACAAGGVVGRAEVTLDERNVHVTSCAAGIRTYHLWLPDEALLISASSIGEARFGETLMGTLRVG